MPFTPQKSPGVLPVEVDQSFIQPGAPQPSAILIGRTGAGPAFYPVTVPDFDTYSAIFGPLSNPVPGVFLPYAAKGYLLNSSALTVVRVLGSADGTGQTSGYNVSTVIGITDTSGTIGTTGSILAVLHTNQSFAAVTVSGVAGDANNFVVKIGSVFAATASFLTSSDNFITKALNSDPTKYSTYGHYVYQTFPFQKQAASASWYPVQNLSSSFTAFQRDYTYGVTAWIKSQNIGGSEFDLFRFSTLGHGRSTNDQVKVQIANVKPALAPTVYPYGTFDVIVRGFYDTDFRPVVLERFANLTLDPLSKDYILKRIGDIREEFQTNTRKFAIVQGSFPNKSLYIRAELANSGPGGTMNVPPTAVPFGFRGYPKELFSGSNIGFGGTNGQANVPSLPYTPNQFDQNSNYNANIVWGVSFVSGGIVDRMRAATDGALTAFLTGSDADFSLKFLSASYVNGFLRYYYNTATGPTGTYVPTYQSGTLSTFALPFYGGFDGWDLRVPDPLYLQSGDTDQTAIGVVALRRALDAIANPDIIDGNVLAVPGISNTFVSDYARNVVNTRKDMFYVMDLTGSTPDEVIANLAPRNLDDNYTAAYYPDLKLTDNNGNTFRVPPSVGVVSALSYNDRVAQAFFAPAGLTRGGLGQFGITDIVDRLSRDDRDKLYDNRINPITKFPIEGIVIFGQKTQQLRPSALDRVNVRRLLILAKRAVTAVAKNLIFEPNTSITWARFVNAVNPILEAYRRDQGINRFKVVMDGSTNTPDLIDRNAMYGKIFLEPTRAAEFISVDFILTPTGVAFGS